MLTKAIIERLNLVNTHQAIGQSFLQGLTIYHWKSIAQDYNVYLMGCDHTGMPLDNDLVTFFITKPTQVPNAGTVSVTYNYVTHGTFSEDFLLNSSYGILSTAMSWILSRCRSGDQTKQLSRSDRQAFSLN